MARMSATFEHIVEKVLLRAKRIPSEATRGQSSSKTRWTPEQPPRPRVADDTNPSRDALKTEPPHVSEVLMSVRRVATALAAIVVTLGVVYIRRVSADEPRF